MCHLVSICCISLRFRSLSVEDESILEMKGVVFIPAKELPSIEGIPYKYVVYTKKVFSGELGCWEKLRGSGELNRYLVIPHKKRTAGGRALIFPLPFNNRNDFFPILFIF